MCFSLRDSDIDKEPKIAEQDIVCYKTMGKSYFFNFIFKPRIYTKFIYLKNKLTKKVKLIPLRSSVIEKGYHTFKYKYILDSHIKKEYMFIIPKETKYYENNYEYVSEQLIYKGKVKK